MTVTDALGHSQGSTTGPVLVLPPPPVISAIKKVSPPFHLVVSGSNLQNGIQVLINGTAWPNVAWKKSTKILINGGASLKNAVPKGATTVIQLVNPDGGTATSSFYLVKRKELSPQRHGKRKEPNPHHGAHGEHGEKQCKGKIRDWKKDTNLRSLVGY